MNGRPASGPDTKFAIAWDPLPDDPSMPGAQLYVFDGKGHSPDALGHERVLLSFAISFARDARKERFGE